MSLDSLPGEVASTGSESELNTVYLADFLTRGFLVFWRYIVSRIFSYILRRFSIAHLTFP